MGRGNPRLVTLLWGTVQHEAQPLQGALLPQLHGGRRRHHRPLHLGHAAARDERAGRLPPQTVAATDAPLVARRVEALGREPRARPFEDASALHVEDASALHVPPPPSRPAGAG